MNRLAQSTPAALRLAIGIMWAWTGFGKVAVLLSMGGESAHSYFSSFPLAVQVGVIGVELWAGAAFLASRTRGAILIGSSLCVAISLALAIVPPLKGQACGCGIDPADVASATVMQARVGFIGALHLLAFVLSSRRAGENPVQAAAGGGSEDVAYPTSPIRPA